MSKKQSSFELANESISACVKLLSTLEVDNLDIVKLRNAATQSEQAARELNQLIGMIEADD